MSLFSLALPTLQTNGTITYGTFDASFPQPHEVVHTPPQLLGTSGDGTPELGTWGTMQWTYHVLRSDQWYYVLQRYRQTREATSPLWSQVLIQWPDPSRGNALVSATAIWEPFQQQTRAPRVVTDFVILFSHLGYMTNSVTSQGAYYIPPNFF